MGALGVSRSGFHAWLNRGEGELKTGFGSKVKAAAIINVRALLSSITVPTLCRPSELEPGLRDLNPTLPFETIGVDGLLHRRLSLILRIDVAAHAGDIVPAVRKR
ncbi:hypothetical protein AB7M56_000902 [Bradyrhizobium elkanii]|nr:hypothetical protein [Bradyrhizobium elkanii]MCS3523005.1 hypothetical protein [Bradyrhizobium elkanii]MCS4070658.1 hypothetical protein [Bradyrhizobium elkanii]MCS4077290.1 hypothetical protein [Bradyrhizobium elkanii]MCS4111655.1 hypothetical protein [Bradyrhizobium elkanii]